MKEKTIWNFHWRREWCYSHKWLQHNQRHYWGFTIWKWYYSSIAV